MLRKEGENMSKAIKVIDLLNKIANGEDVPEHITFRNYDYMFHNGSSFWLIE